MRLPEQRLWDAMRNALSDHVLLLRVENLVAVGFPDVIMARNAVVLPCELKANENPPVRANTPALGDKGLSRDQRNWHYAWNHTWKNASIILIGIGGGRDRKVFLVSGRHCDTINKLTVTQLREVALAHGGWPVILACIMKATSL